MVWNWSRIVNISAWVLQKTEPEARVKVPLFRRYKPRLMRKKKVNQEKKQNNITLFIIMLISASQATEIVNHLADVLTPNVNLFQKVWRMKAHHSIIYRMKKGKKTYLPISLPLLPLPLGQGSPHNELTTFPIPAFQDCIIWLLWSDSQRLIL